LSGLSSGAKLELVQLSKSAGVVSVALQLPESEAQGIPNGRLTDKFPSTTTLWLVLRKFEAGVAGSGGSRRNFTARGAPIANAANSGAGRLYYQQPVLQVMNRELASFADLQKSLAQLGLNSGTGLIRLSFRTSQTPLEEALTQIQEYFDSVDGPSTTHARTDESTAGIGPAASPSAQIQAETVVDATPSSSGAGVKEQTPEVPALTPEPTPTSATSRPVSVFRPPSSSTPSAALTTHNEADYMPTVEHAHAHQKMLQESSRNKRLLTEAELARQANADAEKWAAVKEVEIKVRFPDQSAISAKFGQADSAAGLYHFVRECLDAAWRREVFTLKNPGIRGKGEIIPDDANTKLIRDLQLKGRILVVFGWDDNNASLEARATKAVLKEELRAQAQDVKIHDLLDVQDDQGDPGVRVTTGKSTQPGSDEAGDGKKRLPKWLKGLSKK